MKEPVAQIVAANVKNNKMDAAELPELINAVSQSLAGLAQPAAVSPQALQPAVPIRRSVSKDKITCLKCGYAGAMLRRHLTTAHGLAVDQYCNRWSLPSNHSVVAKDYSVKGSEMAKSLGFGRKRQRQPS